MTSRVNRADVVIVGGGPATLGLLCNAVKSNRLYELVQSGDGIAIVEQSSGFGAGCLINFGINSNTSAKGFLKCCYRNVAKTPNNNNNHEQPFSTMMRSASKSGGFIHKKSNTQTQAPDVSDFTTMSQVHSIKGHKNSGEKMQRSTSKLIPPIPQQNEQTTIVVEEEHTDDDESDKEQPVVNQHAQEEYFGDPAAPTNSDHGSVSQSSMKKRVPIDSFRHFYEVAPIYKLMMEFGKNVVPLSVVGMFLNHCGNQILHHIWMTMKRKIFFPQHRVISIQLLNTGEIIVAAQRLQLQIRGIDRNGKAIISDHQQTVQFRAKGVIISNGGKQTLPVEFFEKWYPFMIQRQDRVILSDRFLQKMGYLQTMKSINENKFKRVVIIGGSHSGFSCAWLMLHGPATYNKNNSMGERTANYRLPDTLPKPNPNCKQCCSCDNQRTRSNTREKEQFVKCTCVCKCFGYFQYDDWGFEPNRHLPLHFKADNITIIYRDKIRVFYQTAQKALADGYGDFNQHSLEGKYVYPYSGLRGDAKTLYKNIKSGAEKRVSLVRAAYPETQAQYISKADIVIWACGYQTNRIPIKDQEGKEIDLSQKHSLMQFDIDNNSKLLTSNGGLLNKVFGSGFAYPPITKDGVTMQKTSNVRANSFTLYRGGIANRILRNILPKSSLDQKVQIQNMDIQKQILHKDKSLVMRRQSQINSTSQPQTQQVQLNNVTKTKPFNITQTAQPQTAANNGQQSTKAWRDILRTPILKVRKAPPSLVPQTKETLETQQFPSAAGGSGAAHLMKTSQVRSSAKYSMEHTTPVKANKKHQQLFHSQVNVKQASRTTLTKSNVSKIKEIITREEGLEEVSNRLAEKQREMSTKALTSFDMVKKQRGLSQSKHRVRGGGVMSNTLESKVVKSKQSQLGQQPVGASSVVKSPESKMIDSNKLQSINNYSRFINQIKSEKKIVRKMDDKSVIGSQSQVSRGGQQQQSNQTQASIPYRMKQHQSLIKQVSQQRSSKQQARGHKAMSQSDHFKASSSSSALNHNASASALGIINKTGSVMQHLSVGQQVSGPTKLPSAEPSHAKLPSANGAATSHGLDADYLLKSSLRDQENALKGIKEVQRKMTTTPNRAPRAQGATVKTSPLNHHPAEKKVKNLKKKKMHDFLENAIDEEFKKISKTFLNGGGAQHTDPSRSQVAQNSPVL